MLYNFNDVETLNKTRRRESSGRGVSRHEHISDGEARYLHSFKCAYTVVSLMRQSGDKFVRGSMPLMPSRVKPDRLLSEKGGRQRAP